MTRDLPSEFLEAAGKAAAAFNDRESDWTRASSELATLMATLTPEQTPAAESLLQELALQVEAEQEHLQTLDLLPEATEVGRKRIKGNLWVVDLQLPAGGRVAVVVPAGKGRRASVQREALLNGRCAHCGRRPPQAGTLTHAAHCPGA